MFEIFCMISQVTSSKSCVKSVTEFILLFTKLPKSTYWNTQQSAFYSDFIQTSKMSIICQAVECTCT